MRCLLMLIAPLLKAPKQRLEIICQGQNKLKGKFLNLEGS